MATAPPLSGGKSRGDLGFARRYNRSIDPKTIKYDRPGRYNGQKVIVVRKYGAETEKKGNEVVKDRAG